MPTILFLMKYPTHRRENLKNKFDGQMAAARALGYEAYCIGWNERGMELIGDGVRESLRTNAFASLRGYEHTKIFCDLMAAVDCVLDRIHVDIMYMRYMPTFGGAVKTMRRLKAQGGRLVIEHPTYPIDTVKNRSSVRRLAFRYTDSVLRKINPMVDLYTVIGMAVNGSLDGRPAMNIVNGVDVSAVPMHSPNPNAPIRLLALASMSGWQGYDRIIKSLAEYEGDADVRIEMVGGDGDGSLAQWRSLSDRLGLSGRVTFHGALYGDELNEVIAQCDVGVCSLGMYRYGLSCATSLKLREYMSRGLPFVTAVTDPALPDDPDFSLGVPNDDTPIDMSRVIAFARRAKRDGEVSARMRAFAQSNMSWTRVMGDVLKALE